MPRRRLNLHQGAQNADWYRGTVLGRIRRKENASSSDMFASMARQPRIEYEGAFYHVMARGDRREPIVEDGEDRRVFLATLGQAATRTGWRVHAWVLMTNHYHWLIETAQANLVDGMRWFQNTYTRRFNARHRRWGHVFGGRYSRSERDSLPDSPKGARGRAQQSGRPGPE